MRVADKTREEKTKSAVNSRKNKRPHKSGKVTKVPPCGQVAKSIYLCGLGWETLVMNLTNGSKTATLGSALKKRELGWDPWKCECNHLQK